MPDKRSRVYIGFEYWFKVKLKKHLMGEVILQHEGVLIWKIDATQIEKAKQKRNRHPWC